MAHSTEPGQRNKHAKILSYIPDPLNLFKGQMNYLLSVPSQSHYHSEVAVTSVSTQQFSFIHFLW